MTLPGTRTHRDPVPADPIPAAIERLVAAGEIAGAVSMVWRDGALVHCASTGWADIAARRAITRDTLFRIASMTKPITTVAALLLLEEGRLALEEPLVKWLPELEALRVLVRPDGPLDATEPLRRPLTLLDLLTHRAGFAYGITSSGALARLHDEMLGSPFTSPYGPDEWIARLARVPLSYQPGERFHYSHASDLLGFLIGRVVREPFSDFLRRRVLEPLGMHDTDFHVAPARRDRLATLYECTTLPRRLRPVTWLTTPAAPPTFASGGQGLISSPDDYLRFTRMLLNGGELEGTRLIERATLELMTRNTLTEAQRRIPVLGAPLWRGVGFGLGVSVVLDPAQMLSAASGRTGAFGWPSVLGRWWQADPAARMILLYFSELAALGGPNVEQLPPGARGSYVFRRLAYQSFAE